MDYLVICTVAMLVASVTLFSGFGLGTVLMPAFAFFFPVPVAIAATAVVHLANNVFKLILVGRHANWGVVLRFALPAAAAAIAGAGLLTSFAAMAPLITYELTGRPHEITTVKAAIGLLIILFAALKFLPAFAQLRFPLRYMAIGGLVSGFFGGLSGNQGAFRSAFLVQAGLSRDAFVGTGVVSAVVVDIARLSVYGAAYYSTRFTAMDEQITGVVGAAILAAFLGSFLGTRLLHKITLALIQKLVAATMILVGVGLVSGLL